MFNYIGRELVPLDSRGLRLAKINKKEELILCEPVIFYSLANVDMVLRRAALSGRVEVAGEIENHFVDLLDDKEMMLESIALDKNSYAALKNKWMRCRIDKFDYMIKK